MSFEWLTLMSLKSILNTKNTTIEIHDSIWLFLKMLEKHVNSKNVNMSYVYNYIKNDGILLEFFMTHQPFSYWQTFYQTLSIISKLHEQKQKNYKNWEIVCVSSNSLGKEILIQYPTYKGTLKFSTAFWKKEWDEPLLFTFLDKYDYQRKEEDKIKNPNINPNMNLENIVVSSFKKKKQQKKSKEEYSVSFKKTIQERKAKEKRNSKKTYSSEKTIGIRNNYKYIDDFYVSYDYDYDYDDYVSSYVDYYYNDNDVYVSSYDYDDYDYDDYGDYYYYYYDYYY